MFKEDQEKQIEAVTMGLVVVVMSLLLLGNIQRPFALTVAGGIILASNVIQAQRGMQVGVITWGVGLLLLMSGIGVRGTVYFNRSIDWAELALLLVGIHFLFKNFLKS